MSSYLHNNERPEFDEVIHNIADYALNYQVKSELAIETAYYVFLDSLACALMALKYPACTQLLGPIVPGAILKEGSKIPGTSYQLDPVQAAFNFGAMIRWLDFNDTWLAAEWGHPSDNLGGILMLADYLNRQSLIPPQSNSKNSHLISHHYSLKDIYSCMIKAHEIQGILALENSFNKVGLDHVILVKVATTAVATLLLGGDLEKISNALSNAWIDGQSLRTYRHAPNTGSRKSWAAGDATSRGVRLALLSMRNEMGYPSALTAPIWGFYDASFRGQSLKFPAFLKSELGTTYSSYVMENILFKVAFPAEFHAQTAVECAFQLHPEIIHQLDNIAAIHLETQEAAMRIINKNGPLHNPADRDHCLQYMVAIGLLYGELNAQHYEDKIAQNPRIDQLRNLMTVQENKQFTEDYLDPKKRSISNSIQIEFKDASKTEKILVEYPLGHRKRRQESLPLIHKKFILAVKETYPLAQAEKIITLCLNPELLSAMPVNNLMDLLQINNQ